MTTNHTAPLSQEIASRIVERISASIQQRIYVTDGAGAVIAGSDAAPPGVAREVALQAIADGAMVRRSNTGSSVIGLPLVNGGQIAGAIVLDSVAPQSDDVAYMARTLAELIIHQMLVVEQLPQQDWAREKFVFDLLHGRLAATPDLALQEAALLDLDLSKPRVVVLVAIESAQLAESGGGPQSSLPVIDTRMRSARREAELLAFVRRALQPRVVDIACFVGDRWLAMLPAVTPGSAELQRGDIARDLERLLELLARERAERATVGVGRYYDGWPALAQSFADARFALEIGREIQGAGRVYLPSDLGVASFVCSNDAVLKTQLAEHLVRPLVQDAELLHTLEVFLDANLSPSVAAERLYIHRHTLAHRLDKITRLTGLDPRRFHELAQLHAALVLHQTCQ